MVEVVAGVRLNSGLQPGTGSGTGTAVPEPGAADRRRGGGCSGDAPAPSPRSLRRDASHGRRFGAASPFSEREAGSSGVTFWGTAWMLPLPPKDPSCAHHPEDPPESPHPAGTSPSPLAQPLALSCPYLAAGAGRRRSWRAERRRWPRTPAGWGSGGSGAASPRWRRSAGAGRGTGPAPSATAAGAAGRSTDPLPCHRLPCWRR